MGGALLAMRVGMTLISMLTFSLLAATPADVPRLADEKPDMTVGELRLQLQARRASLLEDAKPRFGSPIAFMALSGASALGGLVGWAAMQGTRVQSGSWLAPLLGLALNLALGVTGSILLEVQIRRRQAFDERPPQTFADAELVALEAGGESPNWLLERIERAELLDRREQLQRQRPGIGGWVAMMATGPAATAAGLALLIGLLAEPNTRAAYVSCGGLACIGTPLLWIFSVVAAAACVTGIVLLTYGAKRVAEVGAEQKLIDQQIREVERRLAPIEHPVRK